KLKRYQIQKLIGLNGVGAVYRAQHDITGSPFAVKVLRPDLASRGREGLRSFFEEATKTIALNHPSIIKINEIDLTSDGWAFMAMDWIEGRTLEQELKEHGIFSLKRSATLLEWICDAVGYAHRKNIVHRNLKPSNIMLVAEKNGKEAVRILDFGIAKAVSTIFGAPLRIAGSSYYISPEQTFANARIDQSSDIYSLGVILFRMLTGQLPFDSNLDGQTRYMHRWLAPKPLRDYRPDISRSVED